jgi:hypothetical protein
VSIADQRPDVAALLSRYQHLGLRLVYWERKGSDPKDWKGPSGREAKSWNDPARQYPLEQFDPSHMNLGTFTGHEVAPGRFLADVDFDWPEGLILAGRLIPSTGFAFGRTGKKVSHALFTTPDRLGVTTYYDIAEDRNWEGNGITFVELRGGDSTHQTMVAPSLHSPGIPIELVLTGEPLHVKTEVLQAAVVDYAIACLLLKHTTSGFHHDARMALAGFLLRFGISQDRIQLIGEEICRAQVAKGVPDMSDRDIADMELVLRTTVQKLNANKKFAGGPKLAEFIGGPQGKAVVARIAYWFGRHDDFIRNDAGAVLPKNQKNIKRAIELLGHEMSYNVFAEQMLIDGKPLEDPQWKALYLDIEATYRFQPPPDYFKIVIEDAAWRNRFHPVKDYLDALVWDGVPRIDTWIIDAADAEDSPYVRAISSIMLIAAVRRIRSPGAKYDEMVIWESPQGTNKSSAAQALCPDPAWFSDDLQLHVSSKELIEATLGKWIIEASDLAGKKKAEIEQLKAMMSRQVDGPARMAFAHFPVQRPRHFILVGTTNSSVYLPDTTGGRRFWPVVVKRFDIRWIVQRRDQLWAEACVREAAGESIRLAEALWPEAAEHQEQRREVDPWEAVIRHAVLGVAPSFDGRRRVATSVLWDALSIAVGQRDRYSAMRISEIMQKLGFKRTRVRPSDGTVQVGFVQIEAGHRFELTVDDQDDEGM